MEIAGSKVRNASRGVKIKILPIDVKKGDTKDPAACAAALACKRELHATDARIHIGRSYLKIDGEWVRYRTSPALRSEIIAFDRGGAFAPGEYLLKPMPPKIPTRKMRTKPKGTKDIIGEWVPKSEPGVTEVVRGNYKWLRGVRWSEISDGLILRHTTSKRQKEISIDLRFSPMVMEELANLGDRPASGPIVICEATGFPWESSYFRVIWRKIANEAKVPKEVRNMDSRAGAISEATDAGAPLEHVRHAATHSDTAMTEKYSRGSEEKVAEVQRRRIEHRNKKRTSGGENGE